MYKRQDLNAPLKYNLERVAHAKGKRVADLTVVILDRERHASIIRQVREAGARIKLISDGDVAPAVATAFEDSGVDMLVGIGGAPEGVLAAAALKCLAEKCKPDLCLPAKLKLAAQRAWA